jgi:hypothetical protein
MSTSTLTRTSGASKGCGCEGGGGCGGASLGQPLPVAGACAGSNPGVCEAKGLARPRFFAGQLLTEDDLQSLADYVVQKSRLHNRHFVGDGVVCGLQVHCHPCGGGKLIVQAGHALDCCGNDLVLECAVELDINAMVRDLRRNQLGGYDCGDPCADKSPKDPKNPKKTCSVRHYSLYARYVEQDTDPVAPYDSGDACGGSSCEATRVREGVRFELRCRTEGSVPDGVLTRTLGCLSDLVRAEELIAALRNLASDKGTPQDVAAAREAMLDQLDAMQPKSDCALRARIAAIEVPPQGTKDFGPALNKLLDALLDIARDCFCNAILPPCPPCDDPGVLLATIALADCEVVDICNLERKLVLTGPNLRYWLPLDVIGDALESLCCIEEPCEDDAQPKNIMGKAQPQPAKAASAAVALQPLKAAKPQQASEASSADGASAATIVTDPDMLALRKRLTSYALRRLDLSHLDAGRLLRVGENLSDVFDFGALDRFPAVRLLRRSDPRVPTRELLSSEVARTSAFRELKGQLEAEQSKRAETTRLELMAESAKAKEALAAENLELRTQLGSVLERLQKLEVAAKPSKK